MFTDARAAKQEAEKFIATNGDAIFEAACRLVQKKISDAIKNGKTSVRLRRELESFDVRGKLEWTWCCSKEVAGTVAKYLRADGYKVKVYFFGGLKIDFDNATEMVQPSRLEKKL